MPRSIICLLLIVVTTSLCLGQSGREYRRTAIIDSSQVKCVFGNWGVIGQPQEEGNRGAWKDKNNGYIGDLSILIGAEVEFDGKAFHSVITCPVNRPTQLRDEDPVTAKPWTFEPIAGYFDANQQKPALSTEPATWPSLWPDHPDWVDTNGHAFWYGLFGPNGFLGVQEAYFVMDDNNDERYSFAQNNMLNVSFRPDSLNLSRYGLGLRVAARYIEFAESPYCDVLYRVYDITNEGTTGYTKVVFGTLMGTYVGVSSTENYNEYADDAVVLFRSDNVVVTSDWGGQISNPLWVGPPGVVAEAFVDAPRENLIAAWVCFAPASTVRLGDDEDLWSKMIPGTYLHPPSLLNDSTATYGEDVDYIYSSDYFSLAPKETKRIAAVLAYGTDAPDARRKVNLARELWKAGLDIGSVTEVSDVERVPEDYALSQNYPNPFNPSTMIPYALPHRSHVTLTVFNTLGQQVADLVNGEIEAGYHEVEFNGMGVSSGVYFCRLTAGRFVATRKLLLLK